VKVNQIIVDIETAKAIVELPSPYAGTVSALLVEEGQTVAVGTPIIAVDVPAADGAEAEPAPTPEPEPEGEQGGGEPPAPTGTPPGSPPRQPVLVGYGVKPGSTSRRPRKQPPTRPGSYPATPSAPPTGATGTPGGPAFPSGLRLPPGIPVPRAGTPVPRA